MTYPYEGDLIAVFEGVTIPRVVNETLDYVGALIGVPNIQVQFDEILADAWWSRRMRQREQRCQASH